MFRVVVTLFISLNATSGSAQDYSAPPEQVSVSTILSAELSNLPKEPDDVLCGLQRVKKYRRDIVASRVNNLLVLETRRSEYCNSLESYDADTEKLTLDGTIGESIRETRKKHYFKAFELHCNSLAPDRSTPAGYTDIYRVINSRIASLEAESLELLNDCHQSGECSVGTCED